MCRSPAQKKFGFIPFTFEADYRGKKAVKSPQSDRLARQAAVLSGMVRERFPGVADKLRELAVLVPGNRGPDRESEPKPEVTVADLSKVHTPTPHAKEILRRLEWYAEYHDADYLRAAEEQARVAYILFCDAQCPLPKAFSGPARITPAGETFPDFYFKGARLMGAFALLGEHLPR